MVHQFGKLHCSDHRPEVSDLLSPHNMYWRFGRDEPMQLLLETWIIVDLFRISGDELVKEK